MKPGVSGSNSQPTARCWFCNRLWPNSEIEAGGILRSRAERQGGPYLLLVCDTCRRDNRLEQTPRGRWFASPVGRPSVVEYFFSQLLDTGPEDFISLVSWYRANEERRRFFFERDGDARYSTPQRARELIEEKPAGSVSNSNPSKGTRSRPKGREAGRRTRGRTDSRARSTNGAAAADGRQGETSARRPQSRTRRQVTSQGHPRLLSPHEILGVAESASVAEIKAAFRRLARQYHPDKLYHLGGDSQRLAHEKFHALSAAFESLLAARSARQDHP